MFVHSSRVRRRGVAAAVATAIVALLVAAALSAGGASAQEPPDPDTAPPAAPGDGDPGAVRMRHPLLFSVPDGSGSPQPIPGAPDGVPKYAPDGAPQSTPDWSQGPAVGPINPTPLGGYTPAQMRAYLGLSGDGHGQTIGITVAYHTPTIRADVARFSTYFGLPLPCDEPVISEFTKWWNHHRRAGHDDPPDDCFPFVVANPSGNQTIDDIWAIETSMDVEWAHAIAPRARLILVEAMNDDAGPLFAAIDYAASRGATVISNSWYDEEFDGERTYDRSCRLPRAVCLFASGDVGHESTYPAASPYAVAVGGTKLLLGDAGNVVSETAWSGSSGGISAIERRPRYQAGINPNAMRGTPDVSYNADGHTGVAIFVGSGPHAQFGWFNGAGTSAGTPQWAAIIAVANQLRQSHGKRPFGTIGWSTIHRALYRMQQRPSLFDVTTGSNGACGALCNAGVGYDFVTGLGSPRHGIDTDLAATP